MVTAILPKIRPALSRCTLAVLLGTVGNARLAGATENAASTSPADRQATTAPSAADRIAGKRYVVLYNLAKIGAISQDELKDAALVLDTPDSELGEFDRSRHDAYVALAEGKLGVDQCHDALHQAEARHWSRAHEEFKTRATTLPAPLQEFGDKLLAQPVWTDSQQKQRDLLVDFAEGRLSDLALPPQLLLIGARNLDRDGDLRGALDKLDELRKIQPGSREADILRQEIAKKLIFARNEAERKRGADSAIQSGVANERASEFSKALNDYAFALAMSPGSSEAKAGVSRTERAIELQKLLQDANARESSGDLTGAMAALDQLRQAGGDSPDVLRHYQNLKDHLDRKTTAMALMTAAGELEKKNDIAGAVAKYDEAIKTDPELTEARARRTAAVAKGSQRRDALLAEARREDAAGEFPAALRTLDALAAGNGDVDAGALRQKVTGEMKGVADRKESQFLATLTQARRLADDGNPRQAQALLGKIADPRADALRSNLAGLIASADKSRGDGDAHAAKGEFAPAAASYQQAVKGGDVRAMTALAGLYRVGQGVPRDANEAARWYRRAADLGDGEAMESLGTMYRASDPATAAAWFQKAAAAGRPGAYRPLAEMYDDGKGVPINLAQAAAYYRSAAANHDVPAMYRLGQMYELGTGVPKDLAAARSWYKQAADNGNPQAVAWLQKSDAHAKWLLNNGQ